MHLEKIVKLIFYVETETSYFSKYFHFHSFNMIKQKTKSTEWTSLHTQWDADVERCKSQLSKQDIKLFV